MVAVYQLKFPDGHLYIGATHDLILRLRNHKTNIKRHTMGWYKRVQCKWDDIAISYVQVAEDDLAMTECMLIQNADPDVLYNTAYVVRNIKWGSVKLTKNS